MRSIRAGAFIAALLLAFSTQAGAETIRVGKSVPEAFSFTPLDVGVKTGIFKKYGIDIQSYGFGGGAKLQQALAADSIDIGLSSGPELAMEVKGNPVKAVAAMAGRPMLLTLIVKRGGPVKTLADLKGRRVGVSTVGSLTNWVTTHLSLAQGWPADGIKAVPLGQTKAQMIALQRGEVDGVVTDLSTSLSEERAGRATILYRFGNLIPNFHNHIIYASNTFIAKNPAALRSFLKGWFETIAYMKAHKAETVAIAKDVMAVDADIASKTYDELMNGFFSDTGKFDPKALDTLAESFVELKTLPSKPDMSKLVTEAYLPK